MTIAELEECIRIYGTDIYSFCKQLTYNRTEAEDLYQDTFLKAVELSGNIDKQGNVKSYLISIALRIWNNKKRKFTWRNRIADTRQYIEEMDNESAVISETSVEELVISQEEQQAVREAVNNLPEKFRIPVLLYYMEKLSIEEIAEIMKIPKGTVKSRLYKARKLLEEKLEVFISEM